MEDLRALSPEVRQLFEAVRNQVKDFNLAFELLAKELKSLENEKNALSQQARLLTTQVEDKIVNLEVVHEKAVTELDQTTKKAISLHGELKQVQDIRIKLEALSNSLQQQTVDVKAVITDFKYKSEKELSATIDSIQHKVEDELDKESQKIEVRLSLKQKQLEQKLAITEQRVLQMNDGQKKELKMMFTQVEDIRVEGNRLKVITEELNKAQLIQTEDTEVEIERRYKALERLIHDINKKVQTLSVPQEKKEDDFGDLSSDFGSLGSIANKLKAKGTGSSNFSSMGGNTDNSHLAKDIKELAIKVSELLQDRDIMQDKATTTEKKGNLAIWMAGISLVLVVITIIVSLIK
ncbi:MAG: hypothetical protein NTW25_10755 [Candidatus Kapabacteria bacterium]|nr:hypothetical protein [Candidatus Kapabacteria bacterium]